MKVKCLGALVGVLLFTVVASAATINVPEDFGTIQEAVNAAAPGDQIRVDQGVFAGATIDREVHVVGKGKKTLITSISQPFGAGGPKAGFYLPGPAANGSSFENMGFEPFDPDAPVAENGISFPVFCRKVDSVRAERLHSERCVQGVTFTSSTNCTALHNSFRGVTTYFAGGGGIGVVASGEGGGHEFFHNKIELVELFEPVGFAAVGISVIAVPSGAFAGSSHGVTIANNDITAIVEPTGGGSQGIEISTHAGYLPAEGPPHTGILVQSNIICVEDPDLAIVYRPIDEVVLKSNHFCKPKKESFGLSEKLVASTQGSVVYQ